MIRFTRRALALASLAAASVAATPALAQADYPNKPITIVVPFAAGGPTDMVARALADAMRKQIPNSTFVIDNSAGAGGTVGANKVAKAAADGYTLLVHHIGMATSPALYRNMPYNTLNDFEYLGMINEVPMTIVSRPTLPANNWAELRNWINANKGKINLANAGIGSASHLCGLLFQQALAVDMTTVPYRGTAPAMTDLIGGQVDLMCDQTTNTTSQIRANSIKAFAVTNDQRIPTFPNLPTLQESGLRNFDVGVWHGMYAPKGTPAPILARLNTALQAALRDADFVKKMADAGAVIKPVARQTPAAHKAYVEAEIAKWTPVIRAAGVYAD
jgi:tripartite-type tricarboxylate transporter receptor subunit TctC